MLQGALEVLQWTLVGYPAIMCNYVTICACMYRGVIYNGVKKNATLHNNSHNVNCKCNTTQAGIRLRASITYP